MIRKTTFNVIALFITLLALSGCRSARQGSKSLAQVQIPEEIALQSPQQRVQLLCDSYADWQDVSLPLKASVSGKSGISCSGRAVMKRGQWVSISLRMLGFEVASVWIDNDSVHAVDRYHKMYLSESISQALGNAGVTLSDIQDILLGRAFIAGPSGGTLNHSLIPQLTLENSADGLMIIPSVMPKGMEYGFILSPAANSVMAATVGVDGKYPVSVTYSGFVNTLYAGVFASEVGIDFPARKFSGSINWNFSGAKWNIGESRSWKLPSGYKRIPGSQLLRTISTL